jgi:hypothetical protein
MCYRQSEDQTDLPGHPITNPTWSNLIQPSPATPHRAIAILEKKGEDYDYDYELDRNRSGMRLFLGHDRLLLNLNVTHTRFPAAF